jgi:SAM-dependent methyltransferase
MDIRSIPRDATAMEPTPNAAALSVAAGYDAWASTYDTAPNATRDAGMLRLRRWTPHISGKSVLELGCGTGLNTVHLAENAQDVTAIDLSTQMLAEAAKRVRADHVNFLCLDFLAGLPFEDSAYDVAVETLVLEHVADLGPVFAEMFRLVRPGGAFLLSELHPYRQLRGTQARLEAADGSEILIEAHRHSASAFVNGALEVGFTVSSLDEDYDEVGFPRLLSLTLVKPV